MDIHVDIHVDIHLDIHVGIYVEIHDITWISMWISTWIVHVEIQMDIFNRERLSFCYFNKYMFLKSRLSVHSIVQLPWRYLLIRGQEEGTAPPLCLFNLFI